MTSPRPLPAKASQLLPVEAYTSREWFEREQRELFGEVWTFAGMADDLRETGDYLCVQAGPAPLFVVRDETGELRAFHNLCRHRGVRMLEGNGNVKNGVRCFYHCWTYRLDGSLKSVPQKERFEKLDAAKLGLHRAAVGVWKDMVFVHPDPNPEPLENWVAGVDGWAGPFQPARLAEVEHRRYEVKANWKIFIENFLDGYHLWYLHPESARGYDHKRQNWTTFGRHWAFQQPMSDPDGTPPEKIELGLPVIGHLKREDYLGYAQLMFPNLAVFALPCVWSTLHVQPIAPDRTVIEVRARGERPGGAGGWLQDVVAGRQHGRVPAKTSSTEGGKVHPLESGDIMLEDLHVCEEIQAALGSPKFSVGPLAQDLEMPITLFQQNLLDYLPAGSPAKVA